MRMQNDTAEDLVSAWERSLGQPPVHQALALLSLADPQSSPDELARLSIGQRDARLLSLRERLFGPHLTSIAECPRCRQRVELTFDVADVRVGPEPGGSGQPATRLSISIDGYHVDFRLPNSVDLSSIPATADSDHARDQLLRRCLASVARAESKGEGVTGMEDSFALPANVVQAIAERMSEADAQADTRLALCCPECRHRWESVFDIATYLAEEVRDAVTRLLQDVHVLARAYGWRESDILAMTALRRRTYLELLGRG